MSVTILKTSLTVSNHSTPHSEDLMKQFENNPEFSPLTAYIQSTTAIPWKMIYIFTQVISILNE